MKNNLHLIPINVIDIVERLNSKDIRENERLNLLNRLEAIRDYCSQSIAKNSKPIAYTEVRRKK